MKKKNRHKKIIRRISSFFLAFILAFTFCTAPAGIVKATNDNMASVVRFAKGEGEVTVSDAGGELPKIENMRLFNGNSVATAQKSDNTGTSLKGTPRKSPTTA